jgi:hypothetical protein
VRVYFDAMELAAQRHEKLRVRTARFSRGPPELYCLDWVSGPDWVSGDPSIPGAPTATKAPNISARGIADDAELTERPSVITFCTVNFCKAVLGMTLVP